MPSFKKHHFVPQLYLKKWSISGDKKTIHSFHKTKQRFNIELISKTAQKDNIYRFNFTDESPKFIETSLLKTFEGMYKNAAAYFDNDSVPLGKALGSIKGFIIVQSFRSYKLKKYFDSKVIKPIPSQRRIKNYGYPEWLFNLIIKKYTEWSERATIRIYRAPEGYNFITSDNPSFYCLHEDEYHFKSVDYFIFRDLESLRKNPKFCIICPINPKWLGVVYPNLDIDIEAQKKETVSIHPFVRNQIEVVNEMITDAADRLTYAQKIEDFPYSKKP